MLHPRWTAIMQEVDRLYHANMTSEGRIACITDYAVRLVSDLELQITHYELGQDEELTRRLDEIVEG